MQPDYTCPAASATAPACLYDGYNFNDDVGPYWPNQDYGHFRYLEGVRNRNTHWYLCVVNLDTGGKIAIPPGDLADDPNVGDELGSVGDYVPELYFHGSAAC